MTPADLTKFLDELIEAIDTRAEDQEFVRAEIGSPVYDALGLARAVASLIDFGGGILKLPSGEKFKLVRPCAACEVAVPMMTRSGIDSRFCPRCANDLAAAQWQQRAEL